MTLLNKRYITVRKWTKLDDYCKVQGLSQGDLHFGDYVTIGRNVSIRPSSYYGVGHIWVGLRMGNRSSIGPNGWIGAAGEIKMGSDVMIGPGVIMIAENHIVKEKIQALKNKG